MSKPGPIALMVLALVILLALIGTRPAAPGRSAPPPQPQPQPGTFTYGPTVQAGHRAMIDTALAAVRPEARRLIDLVAGSVTFEVGPAGGGNLGVTGPEGDHFRVLLDLTTTFHDLGQRGVNRLVAHELGHVVD